jgi:hypothetical protein
MNSLSEVLQFCCAAVLLLDFLTSTPQNRSTAAQILLYALCPMLYAVFQLQHCTTAAHQHILFAAV